MTSTFLLGLLQDLDSLLATDPNFMLGKWQSKARSFGSTAEELSNLEFNARNQVDARALVSSFTNPALLTCPSLLPSLPTYQPTFHAAYPLGLLWGPE